MVMPFDVRSAAYGLILMSLLVDAPSTTPLVAASSPSVQTKKRPLSVEQQLGRAITLILSDDDSQEAEQLLLSVAGRNGATTAEGQTARYYLGRLYHRNYYMLRDGGAIGRAVERYKQVHNLEDSRISSRWHAEARFYKSLAYLELGKWKDANEAIRKLDATLDKDVQVDYLKWALERQPLNASFPVNPFRDRCIAVLEANGVTINRRDGVDKSRRDAVLRGLQDQLGMWARALKSASAK